MWPDERLAGQLWQERLEQHAQANVARRVRRLRRRALPVAATQDRVERGDRHDCVTDHPAYEQ